MAGSSNVRISVHPAVGFDHQVASPAEYGSLAMETTHNHEQLTSAEFMQATGLHSMPWSSKACGIGAATVTSGCECWYSLPTDAHRHQPLPVTPDTTHHSMPWRRKACGVWATTGSVPVLLVYIADPPPMSILLDRVCLLWTFI